MESERTCVVCKQKMDSKKMKRIVLSKDGQINVQTNKKLDGRGAYICNNSSCLEKLQKNKALNRTFKKNIKNEDYEKIINSLKNWS